MGRKENIIGMRLNEDDKKLIVGSSAKLGFTVGELIRFTIMDIYTNNKINAVNIDQGYSKSKGSFITAKVSDELKTKMIELKNKVDPQLTVSRFLRSILKQKINELKKENMI